jgi:hypothetical protein
MRAVAPCGDSSQRVDADPQLGGEPPEGRVLLFKQRAAEVDVEGGQAFVDALGEFAVAVKAGFGTFVLREDDLPLKLRGAASLGSPFR